MEAQPGISFSRPPMSVGERTRKCRAKQKEREAMVAVAIAGIVTGRGPGDSGRLLAAWLRKAIASGEIDGDRVAMVEEASTSLERRRRGV